MGLGGEGRQGGRGPRDSRRWGSGLLPCIPVLKPRWLMPKAPSSFPPGHFRPSQSPILCGDRQQPSPQTGGLPCPPSAASACPRTDRRSAELAVRSRTSGLSLAAVMRHQGARQVGGEVWRRPPRGSRLMAPGACPALLPAVGAPGGEQPVRSLCLQQTPGAHGTS